jgi:prevent-host-death family protein
MKSIPVSSARAQLGTLLKQVVRSKLPVRLTSHNDSAILIGWDDWCEIEKTLHRLSTPRLPRSGTRGTAIPIRRSSRASQARD